MVEVSKELLVGDLLGDFGFEGRFFCNLECPSFVGDLVGLLVFLLARPLLVSTLSCGGGGPFVAPTRSNLVAIFLTEPAGRIANAGDDFMLFRAWLLGASSDRGRGLRAVAEWEVARGASAGTAREGGGELRDQVYSSPVRSWMVAEVICAASSAAGRLH